MTVELLLDGWGLLGPCQCHPYGGLLWIVWKLSRSFVDTSPSHNQCKVPPAMITCPQFIDLADSLFFVARKKFGHLSPLHVIHHSTLPILCWWGPRWLQNFFKNIKNIYLLKKFTKIIDPMKSTKSSIKVLKYSSIPVFKYSSTKILKVSQL